MKYILADKLYDGRTDGYYAGRNQKYYDMINISPYRDGARKFETEEAAQEIADALNCNGESGYNYVVEEYEEIDDMGGN